MDTNLNNMFINSFTKGMNSDTSVDMISQDQYIFGLNIRITGKVLLLVINTSNSREGIVVPVNKGRIQTVTSNVETNPFVSAVSILGTASIGKIGVVIVKYKDNYWGVYRVEDKDTKLEFHQIFKSNCTVKEGVNTFSLVMNKEEEDLVKVYIADDDHEIMCLDVNSEKIETNVDNIISNHLYPNRLIIINKLIAGTLETQQLQYTYRFYKRKGICSKLAPVTNKILVIDKNRSRENGNATDTKTSIGFQLIIPYTFGDVFDYVLIYRISYIKNDTDSIVNLIHDAKINTVYVDGENRIIINDTGLESLQQLSIEEFAAMNELDLIPQSIEYNQNYLFAANTTDRTMLRSLDNDKLNPKYFIAYSSNANKEVVLYGDTLYTRATKYTTELGKPTSLFDANGNCNVNTEYYLNKFVDMQTSSTIADPCRYYLGSDILGGCNTNIDWQFVSTHIPIHEGYVSNDYKYQEIPNVTNSNPNEIYTLRLPFNSNTVVELVVSGINKQNYLSSHSLFNDDYRYDNIITSSMFRSLKRDEVYRYGIVIYDKYGRRTNVYWIADIRTPTEQEYPSTILKLNSNKTSTLYARVIGVKFNVKLPDGYSYLIVRCEKTPAYTKNLLQCVIARPIRQPLYNKAIAGINVTDNVVITNGSQMSPYYPQQFLNSNYCRYDGGSADDKYLGNATNFENDKLFLIFSPRINVQRQDVLSELSSTDLQLKSVAYLYGNSLNVDCDRVNPASYGYFTPSSVSGFKFAEARDIHPVGYYINYIYRVNSTIPPYRSTSSGAFLSIFDDKFDAYSLYKKYKQQCNNIFYYYNKNLQNDHIGVPIVNIKDVLNPTWEEGWSNVEYNTNNTSYISSANKQYKSFTSNIGEFEYCNWVCSNLYDLKVGTADDNYDEVDEHSVYNVELTTAGSGNYLDNPAIWYALGAQGPGPVCLLVQLDNHNNSTFNKSVLSNNELRYGSLLCNIEHTPIQFAGLTTAEKQYDVYFGFGNYSNKSSMCVFDGDVYIIPCEIVTMFKTYDFKCMYSLLSSQMVYYVPMETTINTFFDYGMSYRNTQNKNLQLEPGEILGISVQDRPITQYNLIYSNNNTSNDVFNTEQLVASLDVYPQRIHYSELKTNGESIDSWGDFKTNNYIDCDTRYGDVTHLLTSKDVLYFWLNSAFGRISVNERSLVTDNNTNTIQLGQGGVLQRTDYVDTKHGIRNYDRSAISAEGIIFWIDMLNKAVIQSDGTKTVDYGDLTNVLNHINEKIDDNIIPTIDYDLQYNELLCRFLKNREQLVFNIKANIATSVYTRPYDRMITMNNILYGFNMIDNTVTKHNYLDTQQMITKQYLSPTKLTFCVNPNASTTKVFDNQEIVTMYHGSKWMEGEFMKNKTYTFNTNISTSFEQPESNTDREGNIRYAIPRLDESGYGGRIRGKWLLIDIQDDAPEYKLAISHIITKFRQSFS